MVTSLIRDFTRANSRALKISFLLICLPLCAALPACSQLKQCDVLEGITNCVAVGPEMLNPRLEVVSQPDLHQSQTIWLRAGEELIAKWDTYTIFATFNGATCDFPNLTEATDDCWICDACNTGPTSEQLCPWINEGLAFDYPRIVSYNGATANAEPAIVGTPHFTSGCSARGYAPVSFAPVDNTAYGLLPPIIASYTSFSEEVLLKVFSVSPAMTRPATYELTRYALDSSAGKVWYKWTVSGDPVWEENFSKNVRIGHVRVLTGRPGSDPNTGRFRLEEAKVVRPSRILFFSDFNSTANGNLSDGNDILNHPFESYNRCYVDAIRDDGDINLIGIPQVRGRCRQNPPNDPPRENDFAASPTYLMSEPGSQLTWFVEFYELEGADFDPTTPMFDPIPLDALLAIEFTIEPVP
jgi:hypothetical protein